jgi:hypothetical protein
MIKKYGTNGPSIIGATGHTQKIIGTATIRENELAQVLDETFKYNLLAVGQDCDSAEVSWIFHKDKAMSVRTSLLSHIGEADIIKYAQRTKGGLYVLQEDIATTLSTHMQDDDTLCLAAGFKDIQTSEDPYLIWHNRIHIADLSRLNGMVEGIRMKFSNRHSTNCISCIEAKMTHNHHRRPVWPRLQPTFPPMYYLIMDTLCPNITSYDNKLYKTTIMDTVTKLAHEIYTTTRDEIEGEVIKFLRLYRRSIGIIQHDNAGEYVETELLEAIANEGIFVFLSVPRKSWYNGLVERFNRTSTNMSNTFRFAACSKNGNCVPSIAWTAAHRAYKHHHNRLPDSNGNPAPLAMITGFTQNISHIRKLFCRVYALNPSELHQKHGKRTIKGWHFGYPEGRPMPCYLIFNESTNRFFCTADCIFDETECLGDTALSIYKRSKKGHRLEHNLTSPFLDTLSEAEIMPFYDEETSEEIINKFTEHSNPNDPQSHMIPKLFAPTTRRDPHGNVIPPIPPTDIENFQYPEIRSPTTPQDYELARQRLQDIQGDPTQYPHITATQGDINLPPVSMYDADNILTFIQTNVTKDAPKGWKQATTLTNKPLWQPAINVEYDGFEKMKTFELVKRSDLLARDRNCQILQRWVWVFTVKYKEDGTIKKRKARCSIDGSLCIPGYHYDPKDTTSVVMSCAAFRLLLTLAAKFKMDFIISDFQNAFLHADIDRDIYAEVPPGYMEYLNLDPTLAHQYVVKLLKQVYGLPQANFYFTRMLFRVFQLASYQPFRLEPAIYYKINDAITSTSERLKLWSATPIAPAAITSYTSPSMPPHMVSSNATYSAPIVPKAHFSLCTTHVDDLGHCIGNQSQHEQFMAYLGENFSMTVQTGKMIYLGKEFQFNERTAAFHLSCKGLLIRVMQKLGIHNTTQGRIVKIDLNLVTAPPPFELWSEEEKLRVDVENRPNHDYSVDLFRRLPDNNEYSMLIGVGNYVISQVRPDYAPEQSFLAKYTSRPEVRHLNAVHQLMRNLIISIDNELQIGNRLPLYQRVNYHPYLLPEYLQQQSPLAVEVITFTDSSYQNHRDDNLTQLGHMVVVDGTPIVWKSYHSHAIFKGVRDGELSAAYGIADIPNEVAEILTALQLPLAGPPMILTDSKNLCDNLNSRYSAHTKRYLDKQLQYLKQSQYTGEITVRHIPRELNWADSLCKNELTPAEREARDSRYFCPYDMTIHAIPNPLLSFATVSTRKVKPTSRNVKSTSKRTFQQHSSDN